MKIVVAMDSFKESLSAQQACDMTAGAIREALQDAEVTVKPLADGGEGTADAVLAADGGEWIGCEVTGPLTGMRVAAGFAWFEKDKSALVEMAKASGLELLRADERNPLRTTTYGTGELICKAAEHGAEKVYLAVGGSATVDCGVGAACAMGWEFRKEDGSFYRPGADGLDEICEIIAPAEPISCEVEVLCDVESPLCGESGAARIYGPQKGASPAMVEQLERGLENVASLIERQLGIEIAEMPGGGAAGGLSAGAVAFMNGELTSGTQYVIAKAGLAEIMFGADWVITGEGRFDEQSLQGKVVGGVIRLAKGRGARVAVLAGQIALDSEACHRAGIDAALGCVEPGMSVEFSIANAAALLRARAGELARLYLS